MQTLPSAESHVVRPRVCSVPEYLTSAGQEAIELAAAAGLHLDQWQREVLVDSLGERPDGRWSAFEVALIVGRQNGKGAILEARELAGLFLFDEQLILHSAHEFKTAAEAFRRVLALVENTDDLRKRVKKVQVGHGDEGIELRSGGRLRFVARSTGSGRGFSGDLVILDEAYALTSAQIEALLPTMSARPNPQIWYTSSPPLDADSGAQLMRVRERGLAGDPHLAYIDFGAKGDLGQISSLDLDDRETWRATNPAYGIRISEEFISRERAAMTDEGFARERLGVWPSPYASADPNVPVREWPERADPGSTCGPTLAIAVDVTPQRDHASIAVYSVREDGIGHIELIDRRHGVDWVRPALLRLRELWNPIAIGIDGLGPAGALIDDIEKAGIIRPPDPDRPERGDLIIANSRDVAAACGQFSDAVRQAALVHIDQAELNTALLGARTRSLTDAWAWARRHASVDISPLVAATLARWAYMARVDLVIPLDYDIASSVG